jgi:hypothetical protein
MKNLNEILIFHSEKYPIMKPCDAVKLIYQNEFGAGHFVGDEKVSFERLEKEYGDLEKLKNESGSGDEKVSFERLEKEYRDLEKSKNESGSGDEKASFERLEKEYRDLEIAGRFGGEKTAAFGGIFFENIGNGYSRLYVAAARFLTLEVVNKMFIRASKRTDGNADSFEKKLKTLKKLTEKNVFSCDLKALEEYLTEYERDRTGEYPPAGHSAEYKNAYFPAYRIVLTEDIKNCRL